MNYNLTENKNFQLKIFDTIMATVYDVDSAEIIEKTAIELKKANLVSAPKWASFVKTGMSKERPPVREDWWYVRTASLLRKIYMKGPIGVSKLRTLYGGRKNRGHKTEHFYKGSGSIIRKILQQLQNAGLIKFAEKGYHKGRVITPTGMELLDSIATEIYSRTSKAEPDKAKPKKESAQPKVSHKKKAPPQNLPPKEKNA